MKLRSTLLALALVATASTARAQQPTAAAVVAMLSGIEDAPTPAEWQAMGPRVVGILAQLARDPQQPGFVRVRAIQAAGQFATPAARTVLRRALRDPEPMLVREAVLSMQRAFGAGALRDVAPLLDHEDTAVREAAIRALAAIGGDRARELLRARLAREDDQVLVTQLTTALGSGS
jgi:HEAT repeat protein